MSITNNNNVKPPPHSTFMLKHVDVLEAIDDWRRDPTPEKTERMQWSIYGMVDHERSKARDLPLALLLFLALFTSYLYMECR